MKKGWVAYAGQMLFPWGQAASRRVYGVARSLVEAGYDVRVASGSSEPKAVARIECPTGSGSLSHIGLGVFPSRKESQAGKAIRIFFDSSREVIRWLERQPTRPSHVILYGGYAAYLARLLPWCRRNRVALVADVVEWYKSSQLPGGTFGLHSMNVNCAMRYLNPKCDGIIAISSYLAQYYRDRGCEVVQVPPTVDLPNLDAPAARERSSDSPITLVYAGTAGGKDLLGNVIRGMVLADPATRRFRLRILGYDAREVSSLWMNGSALPSSVEALGKVAQEDIGALLRSADFSVIVRPRERYTQAGFPTKFVESLAHGLPVIGNVTSDMGLYLSDGVEGIVCHDQTPRAFAEGLTRILMLTSEQRSGMRLAARRQAERSFGFQRHSATLEAFLEKTRRS